MSKGFVQNFACCIAIFFATTSPAFSQKQDLIDIPTLLLEAKQKSDENWKKVVTNLPNYTYKWRRIMREAEKGGKTKEESEIRELFFPTKCRARKCRLVVVLLEKNGKAIAAEKIEKNRLKAGEQLERLETDKEAQAIALTQAPYWLRFYYSLRRPFDSQPKLLIRIDGQEILEKCEFHSPEREQINGREAISLKFRPHPDAAFSKTTHYSKNVEGKIWIDISDKVIFRLLMWQKGTKFEKETSDYLLENAPLAYDMTRVKEGTWFFHLGRIEAIKNPFISAEMKADIIIENFDHHYFQTEIKNVEVTGPKQN